MDGIEGPAVLSGTISHLTILYYITSAKSLFPNKVPFLRSEEEDGGMSFGGHHSAPASVNLAPDCSAEAPGSCHFSREADGLMGQSFGHRSLDVFSGIPAENFPNALTSGTKVEAL